MLPYVQFTENFGISLSVMSQKYLKTFRSPDLSGPLGIATEQRCQTRNRVSIYYKVYNLSCNQVGHDLIGRVLSLPNQMEITASICKHVLCDNGTASCSSIDVLMQ